MSRIQMRFDGGGPYGFGNIRRSHELGRYLQSRGHDVRFVPLSQEARKLFAGQTGTPEERADVVVLDVPYAGDPELVKAESGGARVLALDYDGERPPAVVVSLQNTRRVPDGCRFLCGVEYAILAEAIRRQPKVPVKPEVLVIVGGGDFGGLAAAIVERLLASACTVCVVQGPAGRPVEFGAAAVRTVFAPENLAELMAGCAWGVTTGGGTMLEMLHLGKAVHVVPRTPQEQAFAARFAERSALLGLGLETMVSPAPEVMARCEALGPVLVDGRGCERIAQEVEALL